MFDANCTTSQRIRCILDGVQGIRLRQRYLGIEPGAADYMAALETRTPFVSSATIQAANTPLPRDERSTLEIEETRQYSLVELARFAMEQRKSELHRTYSIDVQLLPAFLKPGTPRASDSFAGWISSDHIADCYSLAHETAMISFFLQRSVTLSYMELLDSNERERIARVVDRLWRCAVRLRPLVLTCQETFILRAWLGSRTVSPCADLIVYMTASHFPQELFQASELIGYTSVSNALGQATADDPPPYKAQRLIAKWPQVVRLLRANSTIVEGFRILSDAFYDLAGEAASPLDAMRKACRSFPYG